MTQHKTDAKPELDFEGATALAVATFKGLIDQVEKRDADHKSVCAACTADYNAFYDQPENLRPTEGRIFEAVKRMEDSAAAFAKFRDTVLASALPTAMEMAAEAHGARRRKVFHKVRDLFEDLAAISAWRRDNLDGRYVDLPGLVLSEGGFPEPRAPRMLSAILRAWCRAAKIDNKERDEIISKSRHAIAICRDPSDHVDAQGNYKRGLSDGYPSLSMIRDIDKIMRSRTDDDRSEEAKDGVSTMLKLLD